MWPFKERVTDDKILTAIGPWMLCCAVGAYNKTLSTSGGLDFDLWFRCCEFTWRPRVEKQLGVSQDRIEAVLKEYTRKNGHRGYMEVFEDEKTKRPYRN
jgi:hypothetical protein